MPPNRIVRRTVGTGVAVALLFGLAGSQAGAGSWADPLHRWGACPKGATTYSGSSLCATEDGGRTWRPIFYGGNYTSTVVRTSIDAGIISSGAYGHGEWWTRDNGGHWYPTDVMHVPPPPGGFDGFDSQSPMAAAEGGRLYWGAYPHQTIYEVEGWPPTGEVACAGQWGDSFRGQVDGRRNICFGPAVDAGMRSVPVISVDDAALRLEPTPLPGGVAGVFQRDRDLGPTVAVRDGATTFVNELPALGRRDNEALQMELSVSWPQLTLRALWEDDPQTRLRARQSLQAVHRSTDGGRTFATATQRGWSWRRDLGVERGAAAAVVRSGAIVLVGGRVTDLRRNRQSPASRRVDAFTPATGRWRRVPPLPLGLSYPAAASAGGRIYVVGGFDRRRRAQRKAFLFEHGRWRALPRPPQARAAGGAAMAGGRLYVVGGVTGSRLATTMLVFDPRRSRWSAATGPEPRAYLGVTAVPGGLVAVGGRTRGLETATPRAEIYLAGARRWRSLAPAPEALSEGAAATVGNRVVTLGGFADSFWGDESVYALDLRSRKWSRLPDLPHSGGSLAAASIGAHVYAFGGDGDGTRAPASNYSQFLDTQRLRKARQTAAGFNSGPA